MASQKYAVCATCEERAKEIRLKTPLIEEAYFCSIACLMFYLKELCPETFEIKPKPIAYLLNKKVPKLSWSQEKLKL